MNGHSNTTNGNKFEEIDDETLISGAEGYVSFLLSFRRIRSTDQRTYSLPFLVLLLAPLILASFFFVASALPRTRQLLTFL